MVPIDQFVISDCIWMFSDPTGVAAYDFDFRQFLPCRTPYIAPPSLPGVLRVGPLRDYPALYAQCRDEGIDLVHTPAQHELCSLLPLWYPLIQAITPRSQWFPEFPSFEEVERSLGLPVFVKGARQTSRHSASLSIVRSRADFERVVSGYAADSILHWQEFVCRELVDLRPVEGQCGDAIPPSFEFRTFWWRGQLVGAGRYWMDVPPYDWTPAEKQAALTVAQQAVDALECTFMVVDVAQTIQGRWIVIECNDGMESGYAGASPFAIWQSILEIESGVANGGPRDAAKWTI